MAEDSKNKEKVKMGEAFRSNFFMLGIAFKACPSRVIGMFVAMLCRYMRLLFFGIVFWEVIMGFIEKGASFGRVIPFLVFSVLFIALIYICMGYYYNVTEPVGNQKMYEKLHLKMFKKATNVELECFENPDFYNKYMKAAQQVKSRAHTVLWVLSKLIVSLLSLVFLFYKTIQIDYFAIIFAIFPMISTYVIGIRINKLDYECYQKNNLAYRKSDYVQRSVFQQDYAKELRLSNGFLLLLNYFRSSTREIMNNTKKYGFKSGLLSCLSEGLNQVFITAGSIIYASVRLLYFKNIGIGEYIILVNAIAQISGELVSNADLFRRVMDNHLYIKNIREFFDYKPKISESQEGESVNRENLLIKMEDVSFAYLGQDNYVLKDINFSISKGEKIVLVGENGAGKTTLVKLLMRLYDPAKGRMTLNGLDVRKYSVKGYRNLFGTVFQDYRIFGLTVAENVLMRRMKEEDRERVIEALQDSGVYEKVKSLPKGIQTTLTREFDSEGAVLSGGESQKIAIARVFAKDCEIAILDEPSSALDPIAEHKMYESMLKACKDRAVVFISHRLSSAVLADKIYMMEQGRIVEEGSHEELMKKNGKYAKMFRFQAENYVEEVS